MGGRALWQFSFLLSAFSFSACPFSSSPFSSALLSPRPSAPTRHPCPSPCPWRLCLSQFYLSFPWQAPPVRLLVRQGQCVCACLHPTALAFCASALLLRFALSLRGVCLDPFLGLPGFFICHLLALARCSLLCVGSSLPLRGAPASELQLQEPRMRRCLHGPCTICSSTGAAQLFHALEDSHEKKERCRR
jgi:hypothetical protein